MPTKRGRLIGALVVVVILATATASHAQFIVFDIAALVKHAVLAILAEQQKAIHNEQVDELDIMAKRLSKWTSLAKYFMDPEFLPEWRPYIWWLDDGSFSRDFNHALSYGDPEGVGVASVTIPRTSPGALSPEALAGIRTQLASVDIADAALIAGTHAAGTVRFESRDEAEAIIALNEDVVDESDDEAMTRGLEKLAGSTLIELRDQQATGQLLQALLGLTLADQHADREADAAHTNMIIRQLDAAQDEGRGRSIADSSGAALRGWQLP